MIAARVVLPFAGGYFLSYLLRVVNAVIAPDLVREFAIDAASLGLLTSAYFLAFAGFQIPLGVLLDRFGARRTQACLLVVAAVGTVVFAGAADLAGLIAGRALIGLGVSGCLMAAFKAFVVWFPGERLPLVNGIQLAAGAVGALAGTTPVEMAMAYLDWRSLFLVFTAVTAVVALVVFAAVPERSDGHGPEPWKDQVAGAASVFTSPVFWRVAPFTVTSQAAFLAVQSLWAGPWLRDVAGLDRDRVAGHLLMVAVGMVTGFFGLGLAAERLARRGVGPLAVAVACAILFVAVQAGLAFRWTGATLALWVLFGVFGTSGILVYPVLSQAFPAPLAGRVNTGLNMLVFIAAFAAQWGIGAVLDLWPATAAGGYAPDGYAVAFALLIALQLAGLAWLGLAGRLTGERSRSPARRPRTPGPSAER